MVTVCPPVRLQQRTAENTHTQEHTDKDSTDQHQHMLESLVCKQKWRSRQDSSDDNKNIWQSGRVLLGQKKVDRCGLSRRISATIIARLGNMKRPFFGRELRRPKPRDDGKASFSRWHEQRAHKLHKNMCEVNQTTYVPLALARVFRVHVCGDTASASTALNTTTKCPNLLSAGSARRRANPRKHASSATALETVFFERRTRCGVGDILCHICGELGSSVWLSLVIMSVRLRKTSIHYSSAGTDNEKLKASVIASTSFWLSLTCSG